MQLTADISAISKFEMLLQFCCLIFMQAFSVAEQVQSEFGVGKV